METRARHRYRITIRGRLSERFASAFPGMALEAGTGQTTLVGELADGIQLYPIIDRLRDFGLELVSLTEVAR
jgi:hypothetical protein